MLSLATKNILQQDYEYYYMRENILYQQQSMPMHPMQHPCSKHIPHTATPHCKLPIHRIKYQYLTQKTNNASNKMHQQNHAEFAPPSFGAADICSNKPGGQVAVARYI